MKKFISILLALMLVMSLGTAAFAEGGDTTTPTTDTRTIDINKTYMLVGDGSNPAETFTLEQVGDGVVSESDAASAPHLGAITGATFNAGEATAEGVTHAITVELPSYDKVGIYTYTLREVNNNNAGVSYFANDITLVVTVVNGENGTLRIAGVHTQGIGEGTTKSDTFVNTYSAGTLNVSKTVGGNLGDKSKYFEFKVTLTGEEGKTYADSFAVSGGSNANNPETIKIGEETTFLLKDGETISIANIPYNVTYTVTETAVEGYETTKTGDSGTINAAAQTAAFTNTKNGSVDTGISLDSLPYILMLVVVGAAIVVVSTRKKGEQF